MQLDPPEENTVDSVGTSYIMRYQVWEWQKACMGTEISERLEEFD